MKTKEEKMEKEITESEVRAGKMELFFNALVKKFASDSDKKLSDVTNAINFDALKKEAK